MKPNWTILGSMDLGHWKSLYFYHQARVDQEKLNLNCGEEHKFQPQNKTDSVMVVLLNMFFF